MIEAVSFYVYAQVIDVGIGFCQLHGVFSLAAAQFNDQRMIVLEKFAAPFPFHESLPLFDDGKKIGFEYMIKRFILRPSFQFVLCHRANLRRESKFFIDLGPRNEKDFICSDELGFGSRYTLR